ncbi:MAG: mechanosensitive ion channel domain-containing protein [Bacteroidota bacterium]
MFDFLNLSPETQAQLELYIPKIIGALAVIIIGFWIAGRLSSAVSKRMQKSGMDKTVQPFIRSLIGTGLKILVVFAAASMVGIEVTGFIAIFSALVFAIGLALQGALGHFASGVLLLFFRPYRVGDLVTIGGGQTGTVEGIQLFNTVLKTLDNKRVIIPNGTVTSNIITNISGQGIVGVELTFGIGYGDPIDKARDIILQVGKECPYILDDPAQGVVVAELADSSVNLATRPFVNSEDYWDARFYMIENVKKAFDAGGINIPFPQMDVHVQQN